MRKPKLEIDLKPIIDKKIIDARTEKQKDILIYAIEKNGLKNITAKSLKSNVKMSYEYIPENEFPVLTFRYNDIFLFREITIDKEKLHFKYLIEESQTK